ncbi:LysR family substrate-binding domain-containing protein [Actinophytocola sp.]|uniref:LysR family substrate-binding domain-containing protein n=1 Tax=Actinophytocola sp. TaxID=1872138 RepID=UPI003899E95A
MPVVTDRSFRLAYVPGVTPAKWVRTWQERVPEVPLVLDQVPAAQAVEVVRERRADAALVRLPIDRTDLHAIPLYTETTVVVVPKDHLLAVADEVSVEDLADSVVLHAHDDTLDWPHPPGELATHRPATTMDAVELVAAGVGLLVVPQSLARLYHRRDLTYRPVTFGPQSSVALTWPADGTSDLMEEFIGVVRGRTVNSTRGRTQPPAATPPAPPAPAKKKRPAPDATRTATTARRRGGTPHRGKRGKR